MKYIPNILTVIRLIIIPIFISVFFSSIPNKNNIALALFLFANFTDFLDGYIARKYNLITDLGKVLDPLADKLLLMGVLYCLYSTNILPFAFLLLVIISETFMIFYGSYLYFKNEKVIIPSNIFGKLATLIFFITIVLIFIFPQSGMIMYLVFISIVLKVVALVNYGLQYYVSHIK